MGNNFIGTADGFVKEVVWNDDLKRHEVHYTDKLRNAQRYVSKKAAITVINNNSLEGFVYSPWEEEPVVGMYEVVKETYDGFWANEYPEERDPEALIYITRKVTMEKKTDATFLRNKGVESKKYYSKEDAETLAKQLNFEMLVKLSDRLANLNMKR